MKSPVAFAAALFLTVIVCAAGARSATSAAAGEYAKHFGALTELSLAVGVAMPAEKYGFKPHPESMEFGELMSHIAATNYQFCAGLKDVASPPLLNPTGKPEVLKFLSDSFDYCSGIITNLTDAQLARSHNSPDGYLPGRDVLLALYIHVAHHRGQAEIYLRDNGIKPPGYRI